MKHNKQKHKKHSHTQNSHHKSIELSEHLRSQLSKMGKHTPSLSSKHAHLSSVDHPHHQPPHSKAHQAHQIHHINIKPSVSKENHSLDVLDTYKIDADGSQITVEIKKENLQSIYKLKLPVIEKRYEELIESIHRELVAITNITMKELTDPYAFAEIKERYRKEAEKLVSSKASSQESHIQKYLVARIIHEMLGLGDIEFLINDGNLEEIVIPTSKEPVRVYSKKFGWLQTNIKIKSEEEIINYANIISRRVGRQITVLNPLLDAHLITGDRINAVLYPVNTKGSTITIRKFARDPFTMIDLIANKTADLDIVSLVWLAMEYEMNILISGGTGSGKTSFLNACMPFIPPNQRIISIEDTRELMLPEFLYWTPLVTRTPNPEGKGEVSMLDLLVNSLRMRPDRIILGEMRKESEAKVLFEAMHTGHSVYSTVHADSASETISRLVNPPLSVPANLLKSIHLNVVMFRDRRKGIRRILQVAEIEIEKDEARPNIIYRWLPEEDKMIKHAESTRFFEDISRNTGMTDNDLQKDLAEKKKILSYLVKENIRSLAEFGKLMNIYYRNRELLISAVNKNSVKELLEKNEF